MFRAACWVCAFVLLLCGGGSAGASILQASVSQSLNTQAGDLVGGLPFFDNDTASNNILPPGNLSITSTAGTGSATATTTLSNYIGPMSAIEVTPSLNLVGTITESVVPGGFPSTAMVTFSYTF